MTENFPDLKKETYPDTGRKEKKSQKEEVKRQSLWKSCQRNKIPWNKPDQGDERVIHWEL